MKVIKQSILIVLILTICLFGGYDGAVISAAQDLTNAMADLGSEITTTGYNYLIIYIVIDINDSVNVRLQVLSKHTSAGTDEYKDALYTEGSSVIKVEPDYLEFNVDGDDKYKLVYRLNGADYVQLRVMAGTVGASAGQIDSCYYKRTF